MDIPEGWEVRESGNLIEITPPQPVGAVHISVLKRTRKGEVLEGEAASLAFDFAEKQEASCPMPSETRCQQQYIAKISFQTTDEHGSYFWDVETHVWDSRALVCSYTHDGKDNEARKAAVQMFASIRPVENQLN